MGATATAMRQVDYLEEGAVAARVTQDANAQGEAEQRRRE